MRADLPHLLPLICPACRHLSERGLELHTLCVVEAAREQTLPDGTVEIEEGLLACEDASCARTYPIIDGIPILLADLGPFLRTELGAVVEAPLSPSVAARLQEDGSDDEPYARMFAHLATYFDAHWGDRTTPRSESVVDGVAFGFAALADRIAARAPERVARAVELGAGAGRGVAELARGADLVVGVDLHFASLRRARRLLLGEALSYPRRGVGRSYGFVSAQAGDLAAPRAGAALLCADALDPPFAPGAFDRVAVLNLLDNVRVPADLLAVADRLCAPGGELLLASPFHWQSAIVDDKARLGGARDGGDPAVDLTRRLREGRGLTTRYTVEETADLPWVLRGDARTAHLYSTFYARARKP